MEYCKENESKQARKIYYKKEYFENKYGKMEALKAGVLSGAAARTGVLIKKESYK